MTASLTGSALVALAASAITIDRDPDSWRRPIIAAAIAALVLAAELRLLASHSYLQTFSMLALLVLLPPLVGLALSIGRSFGHYHAIAATAATAAALAAAQWASSGQLDLDPRAVFVLWLITGVALGLFGTAWGTALRWAWRRTSPAG